MDQPCSDQLSLTATTARSRPHAGHNEAKRNWVFTWNNPPANAYDLLSAQRSRILACNVGREGLSEGRTPHLQGHLVFKNPIRLSQLRAMFPGVHFEIRRGTDQEAREYTEKEGNPDRLDWDTRPGQGARTDIAGMAAVIAAAPISAARNVATRMPEMYIKFHGGCNALARALLPPTPLIFHRQVNWHFGPTGTGKTHTAVTEAAASAGNEDDVFVWSSPNLKFAGTYSGQTHVVIDELRTNWDHFTFSGLLSLLGNSRHEVEVKGGTIPWRASHIWVTAPVPPRDFACLVGDPVEQLIRRCTTIREFAVPYVPAPPPLGPPGADPDLPATQPLPVSDRESPVLLPARSPALLVRSGARPPLPVFDCTMTDSDSDSGLDDLDDPLL